jgi:hypothetical protein
MGPTAYRTIYVLYIDSNSIENLACYDCLPLLSQLEEIDSYLVLLYCIALIYVLGSEVYCSISTQKSKRPLFSAGLLFSCCMQRIILEKY